MKRYCMVLFAAAAVLSAAAAPAKTGIGFRVNGGLTYVAYSDFNDYVDYLNDEELPLLGVSDKIDNIRWVPEVNAEFYYTLIPTVTIGAGAGYISGTSEFSFGVTDAGLTYEHNVKAYPFGVTGYFNVPLPGATMKPYLFGGVAAVYSKITFDASITAGGITESEGAELTTWGYALHGGGGVRFAIFPRVSIDLGVKGRWAALDGYEGTGNFMDGDSDADVFLGKRVDGGTRIFGPQSVAEKDQYEEASVDLSGFSVTLGVSVTF